MRVVGRITAFGRVALPARGHPPLETLPRPFWAGSKRLRFGQDRVPVNLGHSGTRLRVPAPIAVIPAMTTSGGRRDQRSIGLAILILWAALLAYSLWIGPSMYRCPQGTPCPAPAFGTEALLSIPVLCAGAIVYVVGRLPPTERTGPIPTD